MIMKKTFTPLFFTIFAFGLLVAATSCKKCKECIAYEPGTSLVYYYESQCYSGSGSSSKIDDWEAKFRADYSGYYVICAVKSDQ